MVALVHQAGVQREDHQVEMHREADEVEDHIAVHQIQEDREVVVQKNPDHAVQNLQAIVFQSLQ